MKISSLNIHNLRGIKNVHIDDIGSIVIISGQNGSGKSCIFDAIRLLKSVYGGYQQNEWQHWMGEFQIQIGDRASNFYPMMNDPNREFRIRAGFELNEEEKSFIRANLSELVRETIWRIILPEAYGWGGTQLAHFGQQFRDREPEVNAREKEIIPQVLSELDLPEVVGECFISPHAGSLHIQNSILLQIIFSTFRPKQLGVIDFHGAQRHYGRELVQGISLSLDSHQHQQQSQNALYNYSNKCNNVKSEMASTYVSEILAEQAGVPRSSQSSLTNTLEELFSTFFPDKKFNGPHATSDGKLKFPVTIANSGVTHDLDDLSAGEKEILYGYLRIRNSAPRFSIILLDEPELHLNPRLIRGLPQFYREHLGIRLDNQIWLVTHSDTLIREIVGRDGFDVFHMLPAANTNFEENQVKRLALKEDLPLLMADLVGDLAAYQPVGKTIIFEGGGDSDFDQRFTSTLFPEYANNINFVSGSNKAKVRALHELLEKLGEQKDINMKFYAIVDRDFEPQKNRTTSTHLRQYAWDVYHIENYLINPEYIAKVLRSIGQRFVPSVYQIEEALKICAEERIPDIIRYEMGELINNTLVSALEIKANKLSPDVPGEFSRAISSSLVRFTKHVENTFEIDKLNSLAFEIKCRLDQQLIDETWSLNFPGRDILRLYVGKHAPETSFEVFRNLIISGMADDHYKPEGMERVMNAIASDTSVHKIKAS